MPVSDTSEIRGHVADEASGLVLAGVQVEAWDESGIRAQMVGAADTDADGAFALKIGAVERRPSPLEASDGVRIYLRVLRDGTVLPSSRDMHWDGKSEMALLVDASSAPEPEPTPEPQPPAEEAPTPVALTIPELGEALAATAASIQQELAHYPMANGAFLLEDLDVELPAGFGVDSLGQLRINVGADDRPESSGRLRLRVRPLLEPPGPRSVTAPQPLASLRSLSADVIARLESERIYSVGDLLRVSRNAAGRRALEQLGIAELETVRDRAQVVALPTLPPRVAESLVRAGIHAPRDFVGADPDALAEKLAAELGETIDAKDIAAWQDRTRPLVDLPRPSVELEMR